MRRARSAFTTGASRTQSTGHHLQRGGSGGRPGSRQYWSELQSGLLFADGRRKPAAVAFKLPFHAQTAMIDGQRTTLLFGQVRGAEGSQTVRVERRDRHSSSWVPVRTAGPTCGANRADFLTADTGTFLRTAPFAGAASYRLTWLDPAARPLSGVDVPTGERPKPLPMLPERPAR